MKMESLLDISVWLGQEAGSSARKLCYAKVGMKAEN